ncbi:hypothetical protein PILCRDRAFT_88634 [Piloderma croceum F 1598]|uniref:Uncharacterized protein n=1 Tax=Piloderma croceum (strain F 1598) TaxID=765440 RepID=A0A0C3FVT2_PILCF|nr:hypothetical protein PILCRDRAFT_88634 [Piloderma croceum F 1598]
MATPDLSAEHLKAIRSWLVSGRMLAEYKSFPWPTDLTLGLAFSEVHFAAWDNLDARMTQADDVYALNPLQVPSELVQMTQLKWLGRMTIAKIKNSAEIVAGSVLNSDKKARYEDHIPQRDKTLANVVHLAKDLTSLHGQYNPAWMASDVLCEGREKQWDHQKDYLLLCGWPIFSRCLEVSEEASFDFPPQRMQLKNKILPMVNTFPPGGDVGGHGHGELSWLRRCGLFDAHLDPSIAGDGDGAGLTLQLAPIIGLLRSTYIISPQLTFIGQHSGHLSWLLERNSLCSGLSSGLGSPMPALFRLQSSANILHRQLTVQVGSHLFVLRHHCQSFWQDFLVDRTVGSIDQPKRCECRATKECCLWFWEAVEVTGHIIGQPLTDLSFGVLGGDLQHGGWMRVGGRHLLSIPMSDLIKLREDLVQFAAQAATTHTQYIQHLAGSDACNQLAKVQYLQELADLLYMAHGFTSEEDKQLAHTVYVDPFLPMVESLQAANMPRVELPKSKQPLLMPASDPQPASGLLPASNSLPAHHYLSTPHNLLPALKAGLDLLYNNLQLSDYERAKMVWDFLIHKNTMDLLMVELQDIYFGLGMIDKITQHQGVKISRILEGGITREYIH